MRCTLIGECASRPSLCPSRPASPHTTAVYHHPRFFLTVAMVCSAESVHPLPPRGGTRCPLFTRAAARADLYVGSSTPKCSITGKSALCRWIGILIGMLPGDLNGVPVLDPAGTTDRACVGTCGPIHATQPPARTPVCITSARPLARTHASKRTHTHPNELAHALAGSQAHGPA